MQTGLKISFCGDICSECPRYLATRENNLTELDYLSELWYRLGFRDHRVAPEEMKCTGCTPDKECTHHINKCIHLKQKNNCGECNDFPCQNLEAVFEKADYYKKIARERCSEQEYKIISRVFLLKRKLLTDINRKR